MPHNRPLTCTDNAGKACGNCPLNTLTNPISPSDLARIWHEAARRPLTERDPDPWSSPGPSLGPSDERAAVQPTSNVDASPTADPHLPGGRCDGVPDSHRRRIDAVLRAVEVVSEFVDWDSTLGSTLNRAVSTSASRHGWSVPRTRRPTGSGSPRGRGGHVTVCRRSQARASRWASGSMK
jgi:hypothetical protein